MTYAFPSNMSRGPSRQRFISIAAGALAAILAFSAAGSVSAQTPPTRPGNVETMLVKNALTAVNQGNITGNFTVLRDLGSSVFRDNNSAAKLAAIFQNLRERKVDLSPILVLDPQFTEPPAMNPQGCVQLVGFFPTKPLQVKFAIAYQHIEAGWVIDTISVGVAEAAPPANTNVVPASYSQPANAAAPNRAPQPNAYQAMMPQPNNNGAPNRGSPAGQR